MDIDKEYKYIINKFRDYKRDELITLIIMHIRKFELDKDSLTKRGTPLPWLLFLMLKMAFLYSGENSANKHPDHQDFAILYNFLLDFHGKYQKVLLQQDGPQTFFSATAHSQFLYQLDIHKGDFARIKFLFYDMPNNHIQRQFLQNHSITIQEFIEMLVALWVHIDRNPTMIIINYYDVLTFLNFNTDKITSFLSIISREKESIRNQLKTLRGGVKNHLLEVGELTCFYKFPMLTITRDSHILYSKTILEQTIKLFLVDFSKAECGDKGIALFADRFEQYVNKLLSYSGANFLCENDIVRKYGGKPTDFLAFEDDTAIMFEAKSIQISTLPKANPSKDIIINALKDNVIKAIIQGITLSSNINSREEATDFFLVIVTYGETYLGTQQDAWDYFFKDYFEPKFTTGELQRGVLEPNKIFILSILEFELLCAYRLKNGSFTPLLRKALQDNSTPITSKFNLLLTLEDADLHKPLSVIYRDFNMLFNVLAKRAKE
ncbi:MAG: hypothetical protein AB9872_13545 [Solidesulfovibrio sp.]